MNNQILELNQMYNNTLKTHEILYPSPKQKKTIVCNTCNCEIVCSRNYKRHGRTNKHMTNLKEKLMSLDQKTLDEIMTKIIG